MRQGDGEGDVGLPGVAFGDGLVFKGNFRRAAVAGGHVCFSFVEVHAEGLGAAEDVAIIGGVVHVGIGIVGGSFRGGGGFGGEGHAGRQREDEDEVAFVDAEELEGAVFFGFLSGDQTGEAHFGRLAVGIKLNLDATETYFTGIADAVAVRVKPNAAADGHAGVSVAGAAHGIVAEDGVNAAAAVEEVIGVFFDDFGVAGFEVVAAIHEVIA